MDKHQEWRFINGEEGDDRSVQISPDGKFLLIKEYIATSTILKKIYRIERLQGKYLIKNKRKIQTILKGTKE